MWAPAKIKLVSVKYDKVKKGLFMSFTHKKLTVVLHSQTKGLSEKINTKDGGNLLSCLDGYTGAFM